MQTMAVRTEHGWADVAAVIRDLRGFQIVVWQDRTGKLGCIMASVAEVRVNGHDVAARE